MKQILVILLVVATFVIASCDGEIVTGNRSGSIEDDYVEEPISAYSKEYENALYTSNNIINKASKNDYGTIHSNYVHEEMKQTLTVDAIADVFRKLSNMAGPIKNYKELQWGFEPKQENGENIIFSFKIVEHEKMTLNYAFVFKDDEEYEKIIGMHVNERNGPRFPGNLK